jgi:hypothetical protein
MKAHPVPKLLLALAVVVGTIGIAFAVPDVRRELLQSAGRSLVTEDPVEPVDAIVVSVDAKGAGVLEAADLVQKGLAARVAVFAEPAKRADQEFIQRGLEIFDTAALSTLQLKAMGVPTVERIPVAVAGTEDEGAILVAWCDQKGFRSVIFISTADHSRRTKRVFERAISGHQTRVFVRFSRYSDFDPNSWWSTRDGARTGIVELEKLLLDVLRHPFS